MPLNLIRIGILRTLAVSSICWRISLVISTLLV
jgi:hypothetical protein